MEGQSSAKGAPMMSKDDDETDEQQRRLGICLQQVLSNPLVCENIASFLSLSDMKTASQVNPQFLQATRGTRRFAQKAVLVITNKNAQKATLQKTEYSWRGVRIYVTNTSHILDYLPRVLQSAEFVSLGALPGKIKNVTRMKDPTAARLLTTVLTSAPALSYLQISTDFLFADLQTVLSSTAVQETLRNLSRLEILDKTDNEGLNKPWLRGYMDKVMKEKKKRFEGNFHLLTELPNRLKTFHLTELFPVTRRKNKHSANDIQSVHRLLRNNTTTMEQLSLNWKVWGLQELGTLTFPVLKTLSATVLREAEEKTLAKFLEKQQQSLEELTVELSGFFDECLFTPIRGRCMELRKLDLTIQYFIGNVEGWRFLGSMNRLKEFRFKILKKLGDYEDRVRNGWRFLYFLPKNQLECLSLEGISTILPFFWSAHGEEELEFGVKKELLEGFRCLRRLSFMGSWDAVDDQLMQWLLKEFPSLEELQISDCSMLTDAGISGKTTAEWGRDASFADLRRLTTLKIVRCGGVTPNGVLVSCVNVRSLRSLEYTNPQGPIVESVVLGLGQNPQLERIILDYRGDVGDLVKLKAKVLKKNPRVELSLAEK